MAKLTLGEKKDKYITGKYKLKKLPPCSTLHWKIDDWVIFIDKQKGWK